jgi:hypothetical protein
MTFDELHAAVARYSYKPGYRISVTTEAGALDFAVTGRLVADDIPDANHPERKSRIVYTQTFGDLRDMDRNSLHFMVRDLVLGWERHELNEWLCYDGKKVKDPHA